MPDLSVCPFWILSWGRQVTEPPHGHPEWAGLSPLSCPEHDNNLSFTQRPCPTFTCVDPQPEAYSTQSAINVDVIRSAELTHSHGAAPPLIPTVRSDRLYWFYSICLQHGPQRAAETSVVPEHEAHSAACRLMGEERIFSEVSSDF